MRRGGGGCRHARSYDHGMFYPGSPIADPTYVGKGHGKGFTVNIGWNERGIGDKECALWLLSITWRACRYLLAWTQVLMPIAWEFNPDLVLISAGFDAAIRDPLVRRALVRSPSRAAQGGCCITPRGYGLLTHMLTALAGGKVIVALEVPRRDTCRCSAWQGGYNLTSISASMAACVGVLLGDRIPDDDFGTFTSTPPIPRWDDLVRGRAECGSAIASIQATIAAHAPFWKYLVPPPAPIVVVQSAPDDVAALDMSKLSIGGAGLASVRVLMRRRCKVRRRGVHDARAAARRCLLRTVMLRPFTSMQISPPSSAKAE